MSSSASLARLEQMAAVSSRMVAAAQAQEWDSLVALEHDMARLRKSADLAEDEVDSDEVTVRKRLLIEQMLADQKHIMAHVQPWMSSTREELRDGARSRAVHAAYTAHNR